MVEQNLVAIGGEFRRFGGPLMQRLARNGYTFERQAPTTEINTVHRLIYRYIAYPAILTGKLNGRVQFLRVIHPLRRGLDMQILNADLRQQSGGSFFEDGDSRWIQVMSVIGIGQRNCQVCGSPSRVRSSMCMNFTQAVVMGRWMPIQSPTAKPEASRNWKLAAPAGT